MGIIKRRPYVYLVSYTFKNGNGCIVINMTKKIKRAKDLNLIKEYIESQNEIVDNVAIMSFTYVGRK